MRVRVVVNFSDPAGMIFDGDHIHVSNNDRGELVIEKRTLATKNGKVVKPEYYTAGKTLAVFKNWLYWYVIE